MPPKGMHVGLLDGHAIPSPQHHGILAPNPQGHGQVPRKAGPNSISQDPRAAEAKL